MIGKKITQYGLLTCKCINIHILYKYTDRKINKEEKHIVKNEKKRTRKEQRVQKNVKSVIKEKKMFKVIHVASTCLHPNRPAPFAENAFIFPLCNWASLSKTRCS